MKFYKVICGEGWGVYLGSCCKLEVGLFVVFWSGLEEVVKLVIIFVIVLFDGKWVEVLENGLVFVIVIGSNRGWRWWGLLLMLLFDVEVDKLGLFKLFKFWFFCVWVVCWNGVEIVIRWLFVVMLMGIVNVVSDDEFLLVVLCKNGVEIFLLWLMWVVGFFKFGLNWFVGLLGRSNWGIVLLWVLFGCNLNYLVCVCWFGLVLNLNCFFFVWYELFEVLEFVNML